MFFIAIGDKHFSEFLPTRWQQKSTGVDMSPCAYCFFLTEDEQTDRPKPMLHALGYKRDQHNNKKLSYRRGTARCVVSIEILPVATQQYRNYLYDKS